MKFILLACVACVMSVRADVIIDGVPHRTQILYNNISIYNFLRIDDISKILYFRELTDQFIVGRLDLSTSEIQYIDGVSRANHMSVDQATQTLYIGTTEGLYKYNPSNNKAELVGLAGVNVWNAYFMGTLLYYTVGYSKTVYTFSDEQSTEYVQLDDNVDRLLIYNEDITYFSSKQVVYRQNKGKKAVVLYKGDYISDFITDIRGNVYFCTYYAIYQILTERNTVRKIVLLKNFGGMALDSNNNIIYIDNSNIFILKPVDEKKEQLEYIDSKFDNLESKINTLINTEMNSLETKLDTKMDNLEQNITHILQQLLDRRYLPRKVHLDIRNVTISIDELQEEQATPTLML